MPNTRSRSRSPVPRDRRRSRSPRRRPSPSREDQGKRHREDTHGPSRRKDTGFRWKERRQEDDRDRGRDSRLERGYREERRPRSPLRERNAADTEAEKPKRGEGLARPEKVKKAAAAAQPAEQMIVVHVNDRLGTKTTVPCLPSDPIKLFKAQVAALIGRQPYEILLKRQGERPFKDALTLEDYGVSNGVQLDLELDTGD
ncbi:MAG: hypothetical protein M1825_005889 [Sarcosagium campestre]|nr:MAG: hypothetical protein M1825_005889 [Sarcosagium campestre]